MSETFIANALYDEAIKKQIAELKPAVDESPAASYIFSDFPKYYTGAQTLIYIGDVQATDCVFGVGYRTNIGTTPYYGYASRHFDAVLRGKCLVEGEILIYYNKKKYLWTLLSRYLGLSGGTSNVGDDEMCADVAELFADRLGPIQRPVGNHSLFDVSSESYSDISGIGEAGMGSIQRPVNNNYLFNVYDPEYLRIATIDPEYVRIMKIAKLYDKYSDRADELEQLINEAEESANKINEENRIDPSELELAGPFNLILEVGKEREVDDRITEEPAMRTILYDCFLTGKEKNYYQDDKILYTGYTFFARKEEDD